MRGVRRRRAARPSRPRRAHVAGDEVFQLEQVGAGTIGDPDKRRHQGHLFDLLLQEPLHELLAEVIALVAGHCREPADLLGDRAFLVERQRQRIARFVELIAHRVNSRDVDADIAIEQILHQHHRVVSFVERLAVKMLRQLREVRAVEIDGDRQVLLRASEFIENLFLH